MWHKFFGKTEQFFEKGVNFVVKNWQKWQLIFRNKLIVSFQRKTTICFKSLDIFVMCALLVKAKILQKQKF